MRYRYQAKISTIVCRYYSGLIFYLSLYCRSETKQTRSTEEREYGRGKKETMNQDHSGSIRSFLIP